MSFLFGTYDVAAMGNGLERLLTGPRGDAATQQLTQEDLFVAVGCERVRGWSGTLGRWHGGAVAVYGDRLPSDGALAAAPDPDQLLAWCRRSFARFSGALCARDRLVLWTDEGATCPLFYTFTQAGAPAFASEAKALLTLRPQGFAELPAELPGADGERPLPAYGHSIFEGVAAVPAGCRIVFSRCNHGWTVQGVERYYGPVVMPSETDLAAAVKRVAVGLKAAVARMVQGIDAVGVTLSGGVDSSAVAAVARPLVRYMRTYTVGTPFGNEFEQAREAAQWLGSEHTEMMMTAHDLGALLPNLLWSLETWDPLTLQIAAPLAFLYERVAADSEILLTGYGADLIFAGAVDTQLGEDEIEGLIRHQVELTVPTNELAPAFARRAGVVVRYPYWARELKEPGLDVRARFKVRDGEVKYVLRKAVEHFLPRRLAWRPKQGIHQGCAMGVLFRDVLGTDDAAEQARLLRRIFADTFRQRLASARACQARAATPHDSGD